MACTKELLMKNTYFIYALLTQICRHLFTHFFRQLLWTEKQNPPTFSLSECMIANGLYERTAHEEYMMGLFGSRDTTANNWLGVKPVKWDEPHNDSAVGFPVCGMSTLTLIPWQWWRDIYWARSITVSAILLWEGKWPTSTSGPLTTEWRQPSCLLIQ